MRHDSDVDPSHPSLQSFVMYTLHYLDDSHSHHILWLLVSELLHLTCLQEELQVPYVIKKHPRTPSNAAPPELK